MGDIKNPKVLEKQKTQLSWIQGLLVSAQHKRWFGKMTIDIKNGLIDLVTQEQTLKPPKDVD